MEPTQAIKDWVERNEGKFIDENEKQHLIDFLMEKYYYKNSINFSYQTCVKKAEAWVAELNSVQSLPDDGKTEEVINFGNGMRMVQLLDEASRKWEGHFMNHCVASPRYESERIYSLRDSKNYPHCTIQIKEGRIREVSGKGNKEVTYRYIDYVLRFLAKEQVEISDYYLKRLGYVKVSGEVLTTLRQQFNSLKYAISTEVKDEYGTPLIALCLLNPLSIKEDFTLDLQTENDFRYSIYQNLCSSGQCLDLVEKFSYQECVVKDLNSNAKAWVNLFSQDPERALKLYKKLVPASNVDMVSTFIRQLHDQSSVLVELLNYAQSLSVVNIYNIVEHPDVGLTKWLIDFCSDVRGRIRWTRSDVLETEEEKLEGIVYDINLQDNVEVLDLCMRKLPFLCPNRLLGFAGKRGQMLVVKKLVEEYKVDVTKFHNRSLRMAIGSNSKVSTVSFDAGAIKYLVDQGASLLNLKDAAFIDEVVESLKKQGCLDHADYLLAERTRQYQELEEAFVKDLGKELSVDPKHVLEALKKLKGFTVKHT